MNLHNSIKAKNKAGAIVHSCSFVGFFFISIVIHRAKVPKRFRRTPSDSKNAQNFLKDM